MVSLEQSLPGILAVSTHHRGKSVWFNWNVFLLWVNEAPHLHFSLLFRHAHPLSSLSGGLSRHSAHNMEVSPDFGGPPILPGSGSVCLQSERAAHRPAFRALVRPEQNYKVHHPFLQSVWDRRWVLRSQDESPEAEGQISEPSLRLCVQPLCETQTVAPFWAVLEILHSFIIQLYIEDYKVSQMANSKKISGLRSVLSSRCYLN